MDKEKIQRKARELKAILVKYKSDLRPLEKELLQVIADYHLALKEEKLKQLKASMVKNGHAK